ANGKSVIVTINHRGPYAWGRIMDLSKAAARKIGLISTGTTKARIELVNPQSTDSKPKESEPQELARQPPEEKTSTNPVPSSDFAVGKTYTQWGSVVAPSGFGVQVGGFSNLESTQSYCKYLRNVGFDQEKIYIQVHEKNQNKFFKVVIGEFANALDTSNLKAEFRQKTSNSCFTTKHFE
ncbi:MAG: RlpA-like double-psi beta-barrel domain-containing protein, partial [Bacteroidota bacterium]